MTTYPHQRVSYHSQSLYRRPQKQVLPLSALDSATDLESVERQIPEVRPPTLMSDPPLPPINDPYPLIVLSEAEAKRTAPAIPLV